MIYEYKDYKKFLSHRIQLMPKKGRGQARKLAEHLRVQPVVISQIISGDRDFSPEQAIEVCEFFGLDSGASDYFVLLVQFARSGTQTLKKYYEQKILNLQKEAAELKSKIVEHKELDDFDRSIFYSNWFYSGIRLLTSIPEFDTVEAISLRFRLSKQQVSAILEFLVSRNLCVEQAGRYSLGVAATFIDGSSPYINNHRRNWRLKGLERLVEPNVNDLFFSSPCTISEKDMVVIRKRLLELIAENSKTIKGSPSEKLACLNIDWFEV